MADIAIPGVLKGTVVLLEVLVVGTMSCRLVHRLSIEEPGGEMFGIPLKLSACTE